MFVDTGEGKVGCYCGRSYGGCGGDYGDGGGDGSYRVAAAAAAAATAVAVAAGTCTAAAAAHADAATAAKATRGWCRDDRVGRWSRPPAVDADKSSPCRTD